MSKNKRWHNSVVQKSAQYLNLQNCTALTCEILALMRTGCTFVRLHVCLQQDGRRGGVKKTMTKDIIYVCSGFIPSSFYNEMSLGW